jgi:cell division protein FtsB
LGKGSVPHVWSQRSQLAAQRAQNEEAQLRNQRLAAQVLDLKAGLEMIEEKARSELGMVRPDEIFVQISNPKR